MEIQLHLNYVGAKVNKTHAMPNLKYLRHVLDIKTVPLACCVIFDTHLCYICVVWAQNVNSLKRLLSLQKTFLRLTFFKIPAIRLLFEKWHFY